MSASPYVLTRRVLPRTRAVFAVGVGAQMLTGVDLSFGGCRYVTSGRAEIGEKLDLAVCLKDESEAILTRGTIVAMYPHGRNTAVRVRFNRLTNAQLQRMATWMVNRANGI
jgi:hypothetical protein